jgi:hypothetical protein
VAQVTDLKAYPDGPIMRMMLDVVLARIRTSLERFGTMPTETAFPEYIRLALYEELPSHVRLGRTGHENEHLKIMGVSLKWIPE